MYLRRLVSAAGTTGLLVAATGASGAVAAPTDGPILVSTASPELKVGEEGAGSTTVTLLNPTRDQIVVTISSPAGSPGCDIDPTSSSLTLPASSQHEFTVRFTNCDADKAATTAFALDAAGDSVDAILVTVKPPAETSPNWSLLLWFFAAFVGGLVACVIGAFWWRQQWGGSSGAASVVSGPSPLTVRSTGDASVYTLTSIADTAVGQSTESRKLWMPLSGLAAGWTFKDSWASNATVLAAAITGLFGVTEIAESILGKSDAKAVLSIVAVATAIAVGLAGTSPMILQIASTRAGKLTPVGLILAGTVTTAATGGVLLVTIAALDGTAVDQNGVLLASSAVGCVVLVAYAMTATQQNLAKGSKLPDADKPTKVILVPKDGPEIAGLLPEADDETAHHLRSLRPDQLYDIDVFTESQPPATAMTSAVL